MTGQFQPKYDQEMSERFYMRMTPDQKSLLKEAAHVVNREASELWRELFIGIAESIVKEASGEISSAELKELAGEMVLNITRLRDHVHVSDSAQVEVVDG